MENVATQRDRLLELLNHINTPRVRPFKNESIFHKDTAYVHGILIDRQGGYDELDLTSRSDMSNLLFLVCGNYFPNIRIHISDELDMYIYGFDSKNKDVNRLYNKNTTQQKIIQLIIDIISYFEE